MTTKYQKKSLMVSILAFDFMQVFRQSTALFVEFVT